MSVALDINNFVESETGLKKNIRIGIVILNYMAYEVTINCVKDFLTLNQLGVILKIVVVDNCSSNDSYVQLKNEFYNDSRITVIKTDKNLGFANGNNYGYDMLIKNFKPNFTIIANDDILLPDKSLINWIIESMEKYNFAVLGPSVYSTKGEFYQSPMENFSTDKGECLKKLFGLYISLLKVKLKMILHVNYKQREERKCQDSDYRNLTYKKTLHGSFLVFSEKYFECYDEPFDSGTFLYMEENILRLRCDKRNLRMVYTPEYCVHHLQSVATNMVSKNQLTRDYKRIKNIIKSLQYYISLI